MSGKKTFNKLLVVLLLVALGGVMVNFQAMQVLGYLEGQADDLARKRLPAVLAPARMNNGLNFCHLAQQQLALTGPDRDRVLRENLKTGFREFEEGRKTYELLPQTREEEHVWKECQDLVNKWKEMPAKVEAALEEKDNQKLATLFNREQESFLEIQKILSQMQHIQEAENQRVSYKEIEILQNCRRFLGVGMALSLFLALLVGVSLKWSWGQAARRVGDETRDPDLVQANARSELNPAPATKLGETCIDVGKGFQVIVTIREQH